MALPPGRNIRVGTCSWTEKTPLESGDFYPKGVDTAEDRLRFYAAHFDAVEVDSTYYAIPGIKTTQLWAERTPPGFLFHIKAHGALTGHGIAPKRLPTVLREQLSAEERDKERIYPSELLLKAIVEAFLASLEPLKVAGKLGVIVCQYPPWFWYKSANLDIVLRNRERIGDYPMAVEFRHGSWLTENHRDQVLKLLRENGITYITADEPQYGTLVTVPFQPEATTGIAYLRLHGRNKATWLLKGAEASVRYAYLYTAPELQRFIETAQELSHKARMVFVMFNNCHLGYAVKNALEMQQMMR